MNQAVQPAEILIVENHSARDSPFTPCLKHLGHRIHKAHNLRNALQFLNSAPVDLIFIDLETSRLDGLHMLNNLREHDPEIIVIFLTSHNQLETSLAALRSGAFDCLSKPVPEEILNQTINRGLALAQRVKQRRFLLQQIREQLDTLESISADMSSVPFSEAERSQPAQSDQSAAPPPEPIRLGNWIIRPSWYQIQSKDIEIHLTPTEQELLLYLAQNQDRVVPCGELVRELRGYPTEETEARLLIRPHISNLRRKLRSFPGQSEYIFNIRGKGYCLSTEPTR